MTPEIQTAMLQYEELKISEKEIKDRLDELKEIILPHVEAGKKYAGEHGSFEVKSRATWKFSPELIHEKDIIKEKEADEIARGIAKNNPTVFIEYRMKK